MKQRLLLLLFLGVISIFAVSGLSCRSANKESKNLKLWIVGYTETNFKNRLTNFKSKYNATVEVTQKTTQNLEKDLMSAMANHQGPDVVMIDNDFLFKHKDLFMPCAKSVSGSKITYCDAKIVKDQYAEIINSLVFDDKIYAYPYKVSTPMVIYNTEMFAKVKNKLKIYQIPYYWDDFVALVRALTQKDSNNNIKVSGLAIGNAANVPDSQDILYSIMIQNGTNVSSTSPPPLALFHTPIISETGATIYPGVLALDFYTSFTNKQSKNYSFDTYLGTAWEALANEKTAMIIDYPERLEDIRRLNKNIRVDGALFPQIKDVENPTVYGKVFSFGVTNDTDDQVLAWELARTLSQNFNNRYVKKQATTRDWRNSRGTTDVWQTQVAFAKAVFKNGYPDEFDQNIREMIDFTASKKATSRTAIDKAADKINQLIVNTKN